MAKKENEIQVTNKNNDELIAVLGSSLYVGAKPESIGLVLSYCDAIGLDPMQKPVHIVPMNTKNAVTGKYEWRDVVMPGIGLYRIQADRSKTMAGITEPEYGPMVYETFKDKAGNNVECTFPEWCKITVKKIVGSHIVDFVAKEYWIENYATDSGQSTAPNVMWRKRSRGQIAKCAEAQALRKAFPEVGAQPTAEEMEGKIIDITGSQDVPLIETITDDDGCLSEDKFNGFFPKWEKIIQDGKQSHAQLLEFIEKKNIKLAPGHIDLINKVEVTAK